MLDNYYMSNRELCDLIYRTFIWRGEFVDKIGSEWCIFTITTA